MISQIEAKLLCGEELTFDEAVRLAGLQGKQVHQLIALAGKITDLYTDGQIDLCSIINAKSGLCSEDCKFCAQSAHYHTGIKHYELLDKETILLAAEQVKARGIHRFSLVTSGKELPEDDFARALDIYRSPAKNRPETVCLPGTPGRKKGPAVERSRCEHLSPQLGDRQELLS